LNPIDKSMANKAAGVALIVVVLVVAAAVVARVASKRALLSVEDELSSMQYDDLIVEAQMTVASIRNAREAYQPLGRPKIMEIESDAVGTRVKGGSGSLWLSLIALDGKRPLAVLNNKVVGLQDKVGGFTVIAIGESSVTVSDDKGNEKTLRLYKNQRDDG